MNFNLKSALISMGYRNLSKPHDPEVWAKPVGFSVFSVKDANGVSIMTCSFKAKGELMQYNSFTLDLEDSIDKAIYQIAYLETQGRSDIGDLTEVFSFANLGEVLELR